MGFALFDSAIGTCAVAWSEQGTVRVVLPEANETALRRRFVGVPELAPPKIIRGAIKALQSHLLGKRADLSTLVLDMSGVPPFHQQVYAASRKIPSGSTVTYGELAAMVGKPGAARAVGQALGKNPFAIVVPCHRILAANKGLGGFSAFGGVETKKKILATEGYSNAPRVAESASTTPFDAKKAIRHLAKADKTLGSFIATAPKFQLKLRPSQSIFAALAESIAYQQLTGKAAATIFARVEAACGKLTPERVMKMTEESLRACGLSRAKVAAFKDLAEKTLDGTVPTAKELSALDDDAAIERITSVRGIGPWTVEMLLIFRLGRPDVLPVSDYGVRKGFSVLYNRSELPSAKELLEHGERWRPYRSVASWYLWRASEFASGAGGRAA